MGHVALQTTADTKQNYVRVAWDAGEYLGVAPKAKAYTVSEVPRKRSFTS